MLHIVNAILHILVYLVLGFSGQYGGGDLLVITACLAVSWTVSCLGLPGGRSSTLHSRKMLSIGIILLFWVAYVSKAGFAVILAHEYWAVPKLISESDFLAILPEALAVATMGYAAVMVGIFSFPLHHRIDWCIQPAPHRNYLLVVFVVCMLVGKYWLKDNFLLGIPGVAPVDLGIPYLTGILTLLIEHGFLFLVSAPVLLALVSGNRRYLVVALILAFSNSAVDLSFGSKDTIMYQIVIILAYLAILNRLFVENRSQFAATARVCVASILIVSVFILFSYKYMNFFRFALHSGAGDLGTAIDMAVQNKLAQSRSSFMEIYNRIIGLDVLAAVMHLKQDLSQSVSLSSFFDGSVMRRFTDIVMDGADSKVAFSVTQFGYFYILGGLPVVVLGCGLLAILFSGIQSFIINGISVSHTMRLAFLPIFWLKVVIVLLGSGNLILWAKGLVVTLLVFYLFSKLVMRRRSPDLVNRNLSAGLARSSPF